MGYCLPDEYHWAGIVYNVDGWASHPSSTINDESITGPMCNVPRVSHQFNVTMFQDYSGLRLTTRVYILSASGWVIVSIDVSGESIWEKTYVGTQCTEFEWNELETGECYVDVDASLMYTSSQVTIGFNVVSENSATCWGLSETSFSPDFRISSPPTYFPSFVPSLSPVVAPSKTPSKAPTGTTSEPTLSPTDPATTTDSPYVNAEAQGGLTDEERLLVIAAIVVPLILLCFVFCFLRCRKYCENGAPDDLFEDNVHSEWGYYSSYGEGSYVPRGGMGAPSFDFGAAYSDRPVDYLNGDYNPTLHLDYDHPMGLTPRGMYAETVDDVPEDIPTQVDDIPFEQPKEIPAERMEKAESTSKEETSSTSKEVSLSNEISEEDEDFYARYRAFNTATQMMRGDVSDGGTSETRSQLFGGANDPNSSQSIPIQGMPVPARFAPKHVQQTFLSPQQQPAHGVHPSNLTSYNGHSIQSTQQYVLYPQSSQPITISQQQIGIPTAQTRLINHSNTQPPVVRNVSVVGNAGSPPMMISPRMISSPTAYTTNNSSSPTDLQPVYTDRTNPLSVLSSPSSSAANLNPMATIRTPQGGDNSELTQQELDLIQENVNTALNSVPDDRFSDANSEPNYPPVPQSRSSRQSTHLTSASHSSLSHSSHSTSRRTRSTEFGSSVVSVSHTSSEAI